jgi:hypothetical protein
VREDAIKAEGAFVGDMVVGATGFTLGTEFRIEFGT